MTIPKKGRRTITVDGQVYHWRIRRAPTYTQGAFGTAMTLAVQHSTPEDRCVLLVDLVVSRPDSWLGPHQTAVTPATVRDIILTARTAGWTPTATSPFRLRYPLIQDR